MLVRLLYASRAREPFETDMLDTIAAVSVERNPQLGITGVLCYGDGCFLQALEGDRDAVSRLYHRIAVDPRHHDLTLLHYQEIVAREFAGWAMGHVNTGRVNAATLLKFFPQAAFDPYRIGGEAALALLGDLIAGAAIVARTTERGRF